MLFNEPKLLKYDPRGGEELFRSSFSALQRAEIAEILRNQQRRRDNDGFSALQRAEIAEISSATARTGERSRVSVLFNEPKLLKWYADLARRDARRRGFSALQRAEIAEMGSSQHRPATAGSCFSALQRAEIAEISPQHHPRFQHRVFQCSSTSRNC